MIDTLIGLLVALAVSPAAQAASLNSPPVQQEIKPKAPATPVRAIAPKKRSHRSVGIETGSRSVFVADVATGEVLYAKRPHDVLPIASLTKLMTAMVFLDGRPNLDERITFRESDFDGESKAVFVPGETVTKSEALQALLIGSVNAAGSALARTSLGDEQIVKVMNEKARALRLASPVFTEPTGVDPANRANAADVAAMLTLAMTYPEIREAMAKPSVNIRGGSGKEYLIKSTNLLLSSFLNKDRFKIVGAKTGSLPQAGFCMAQVTRDQAGHEVVVVNMASQNHFSRFQEIKALTAWAFETFEW